MEDSKESGMSRRKFLALLGGTAATAIAFKGNLLNATLNEEKGSKNPARPSPDIKPKTIAQPSKKEAVVSPEKILPNEIIQHPLKSTPRLTKEAEYVHLLKRRVNFEPGFVQLIDRGFWVISDAYLRTELMDLRFQLRNAGVPELGKLTDQQKRWIKDYKIHPEVLGICLDAEQRAKTAIEKLLNYSQIDFRKDLSFLIDLKLINPGILNTLSADKIMINPGGMTQLICTETGYSKNGLKYGFANIGSEQAISQINQAEFPTAISMLEKMCRLLKEDIGLDFVPDNIPGSAWGNRKANVSGGAIGLQFMPNKALEIYSLLYETGFKFNPFDPESSVIGAWVFLAQGEKVEKDVRYGYLKGDEEKIKKSLLKWNPSEPQVATIYKAAVDYYDQLIAPQNL